MTLLDEAEEPPEVWVNCTHCNGEGALYQHQPFPDDPYFERTEPCPECGGAGGFIDEPKPDVDRPPWRHFTDEEAEGWERVFASLEDSKNG